MTLEQKIETILEMDPWGDVALEIAVMLDQEEDERRMAAKKKPMKRKPAKVDTVGVEEGVPGVTAPFRQGSPFKKKKKKAKKTP